MLTFERNSTGEKKKKVTLHSTLTNLYYTGNKAEERLSRLYKWLLYTRAYKIVSKI